MNTHLIDLDMFNEDAAITNQQSIETIISLILSLLWSAAAELRLKLGLSR